MPSLVFAACAASSAPTAVASIDSQFPLEEPDDGGDCPDELDGDAPEECDDEVWDALVPDDDYEPEPDWGDFWPEPEWD